MPRPKRAPVKAKTYRLIPTRFPSIQLFEDLLDPAELEAAYALESLTNDRLQDEAGNITLVPEDERVVGPGTSAIMAAFTHIGYPSRFSDGSFGVYYAGLELDTALAESRYSQTRRLTATAEPAQLV
ncbi:MAG: RES family NAD+ phosphorylase, partial [Parahaliea sp.]